MFPASAPQHRNAVVNLRNTTKASNVEELFNRVKNLKKRAWCCQTQFSCQDSDSMFHRPSLCVRGTVDLLPHTTHATNHYPPIGHPRPRLGPPCASLPLHATHCAAAYAAAQAPVQVGADLQPKLRRPRGQCSGARPREDLDT